MVYKRASKTFCKSPTVKAVIFDMDGTITKFNLDIDGIKREILGDDYNGTLLEGINKLKGEERERAEDTLIKKEISAANRTELNKGVEELLDFLQKKGIKKALVTRNNRRSVEVIFKRFGLSFDVVVSREDAPPKPDKAQLNAVLMGLGVDKEDTIFVGDHPMDLEAGRRVGIRTVLIKNRFSQNSLKEADFVIERMDEVIDVINDNFFHKPCSHLEKER
ncbi:MAG: HAD family hydrolase [Candidatus Hydrothermarchaeales archaeon]